MDINTFILMNVIGTITSASIRLIEYLAGKISEAFPIIVDYYQTFRYGSKISFTDVQANYFTVMWPAMAVGIIKYVEEYTGKSVNDYKYSILESDITKDIISIETPNLGIRVSSTSADIGKGDSRKMWTTTVTFYSRIHSHEEFTKILTEIANKTYKRCTNDIFLTRSMVDDKKEAYHAFDRNIVPRTKIHVNVTNDIIETITENDRGNFMLYGPPGTGKTTIINQIAEHFNACVFIANLAEFENIHSLRKYFLTTSFSAQNMDGKFIECRPKIRIYLFEDFNTTLPLSFWEGRTANISEDTSNDEKKSSDLRKPAFTKYSYADLINLLDGVIPLTGAYTFWTTNHIEDINSSLHRPGRMEKYHVHHLEEACSILGMTQTEYNKAHPNGLIISEVNNLLMKRV